MNKRLIAGAAAAVVVCSAVVAGGLYLRSHVKVAGEYYSKNLDHLDLQGKNVSAAQYDTLRADMPDADITWDVPFQNGTYPCDTTEITVTTLSMEDVEALDYLTQLKVVHAQDCSDAAALYALQQRRPEVTVDYKLTIGGKTVNCRSSFMNVSNVDYETLNSSLSCLLNMQRVTLSGTMPTPDEVEQLVKDYPDTVFLFEVDGHKFQLDAANETLNLSGVRLSSAELEQYLAYFPNLKTLNVINTGLDSEYLDSLADRLPSCDILRNITLFGVELTTDATVIDFSGIAMSSTQPVEDILHYFPYLERVIMCDCGLDTPIMAAVNDKYENIRFVWSMYLKDIYVRTDDKVFAPVKENKNISQIYLEDLKYCIDMECIDLGHMPMVNCDWAAYMPNLKYLILADSGIRDISGLSNCKNLIFLEIFVTCIDDASPLLGCTALQDLNISWTWADEDKYNNGERLTISQMPWLKNLWCPGPYYVNEDTVGQYLPDTHIVYYTNTASSTGGGWRKLQNYYNMRDMMGMFYINEP